MAAIKKRALAEYQSQVAVEDKETSSPESKRLKLALRSESPEPLPVESILPVLDTECVSIREVLENIINFNISTVPSHSTEVVAATLKKLSETVSKEKDDCVKAALVNLWGEILGVLSSEEMATRLDDFISLTEKSNKVLVAWLAEPQCCDNISAISPLSFSPHFNFVNGPPPI